MPRSIQRIASSAVMASVFALSSVFALTGCGNPMQSAGYVAQAPTKNTHISSITFIQVNSVRYHAVQHDVTIVGTPVSSPAPNESTIDVSDARGTTNFIYTHFPRARVNNAVLRFGHRNHLTFWIGQIPSPGPKPHAKVPTQAALRLPPTGASLDPSVIPVAKLQSSVSAKRAAVLKVAASKLGTPYIWGHSEDRGQRGFDCSNFTAYVYHHALGYVISGMSKVQYHVVGTPIPTKDMEIGDLIVFDHGAHVGIYTGHHMMIEEGGGLGKVGYLSVAPGSTWGKRITVVKRMF